MSFTYDELAAAEPGAEGPERLAAEGIWAFTLSMPYIST